MSIMACVFVSLGIWTLAYELATLNLSDLKRIYFPQISFSFALSLSVHVALSHM